MGWDMTGQKIIMDASDIDRTLNRIAFELLEHNRGAETFAFIGIRRRGVSIANRLSRKLQEFTGVRIPVGALDITLYRDDLSEIASHPVLKKTEIPFPIKGMKIYLCDDVLYTGRTIRAALDGIHDLGRPEAIRLVVLIDRGHRELPIQPDYTGRNVATTKGERVEVLLHEDDGIDQAFITGGA